MTLLSTAIITFFIVVISVILGLYVNLDSDINSYINRVIYSKDNQLQTSSDAQDIDIHNVICTKGDKIYTKDTLAKYNGEPGSLGLHLAILGRVYDVGKGKQHYGPGGGYSFFAGKDGTQAYMTGEFNEKGLIDDATGLTSGQMLELENWIQFYDKTYTYKGKLIGNFYNEEGEPSQALYDAVDGIKAGHQEKKEKEAEKRRFPPCNSQSKKGEYRRVFCTEKSGGIHRTWIGYPRQFFTTGSDSAKCVCVNNEDLNHSHLKEYDGCDSKARSCSLPPL